MRYELSDHEWTAIKPMLPNKPRRVPRVDDRRVLNGIFWVLRSGASWRTCRRPMVPAPPVTTASFVDRKNPICFSPYLYRARNLIERFFNKIKQCRRIATRHDKLAADYPAFIKLASIRIWLRADEFSRSSVCPEHVVLADLTFGAKRASALPCQIARIMLASHTPTTTSTVVTTRATAFAIIRRRWSTAVSVPSYSMRSATGE